MFKLATSAKARPSGSSTVDDGGVKTLARILVVDDEEYIRRLMHTWLQGAGHEVMEASDGRQAVKVLNSADALVDLVVTDVYMPEADGFELVTYCRNRGIRVVAMSGGHPKIPLDVLDVARTMGACATLQKPFEKAELLQAIERAVGSGAG